MSSRHRRPSHPFDSPEGRTSAHSHAPPAGLQPPLKPLLGTSIGEPQRQLRNEAHRSRHRELGISRLCRGGHLRRGIGHRCSDGGSPRRASEFEGRPVVGRGARRERSGEPSESAPRSGRAQRSDLPRRECRASRRTRERRPPSGCRAYTRSAPQTRRHSLW